MRRSLLLVAILLATVPRSAFAEGGYIQLVWFYAWSAGTHCAPDQRMAAHTLAAWSCDTLAFGGIMPWDEWYAQTGQELPEMTCFPLGAALPPPVAADNCSTTKKYDPASCKTGAGSSDARNGSFGRVGDPVDLTTGVLSLDPMDVDLGHGLELTRHYSSNGTLVTAMGKAWQHSLDWRLNRLSHNGSPTVYLVKEPLRSPITFVSNGQAYTDNLQDGGSLTTDASGSHYRSASGKEADFDTLDRLVAIRLPGEKPISVSYGGDTTTFSNGAQTLAINKYPTGHANAGRMSSVVANGETWSYAYDAAQYLKTVVGPDASTASPTDTVTWAYVYTGGRVTRIDRTSGSGTTTLGAWAFIGSPARVSSADEPALEQPLLMSYANPATGRLQATVKNSSSQVLALFDSTNGAVTSVTNTSGPAAPVAGGPGVPVPFKAATTLTLTNFLTKTQTDQNGNLTLPLSESSMDLSNNAVGRQCAGGPTPCADACMDKLKSGKLFGLGGAPMPPPVAAPPVPSGGK